MTKKTVNSDYRIPATCHVCGKDFLARYNVGDRAKVCTDKDHVCRRRETPRAGGGTRIVVCVEKCCRSQYGQGATAAAMDSSIDPRFVLAEDEFAKVWKGMKRIPDPEGICLRFIARTGCRLEEARLVRPGSVSWKTGIYSEVAIPTIKRKGRPIRRVLIANVDEKFGFTEELRRWTKRADPKGPLFQVARRTLQATFERIVDPIKPDRGTLVHILRHTRASQLIESGADYNFVRGQLGWSSLEMAKRYIHTSEGSIAKVLEKI
jgi:integrase